MVVVDSSVIVGALHFENQISRQLARAAIVLNTKEHRETLALLSREGIAGGRIYDGLIGATARTAGARLITADWRAVSVYSLVGVEFELLDTN